MGDNDCVCPLCNQTYPQCLIEQHVDICLRAKQEREDAELATKLQRNFTSNQGGSVARREPKPKKTRQPARVARTTAPRTASSGQISNQNPRKYVAYPSSGSVVSPSPYAVAGVTHPSHVTPQSHVPSAYATAGSGLAPGFAPVVAPYLVGSPPTIPSQPNFGAGLMPQAMPIAPLATTLPPSMNPYLPSSEDGGVDRLERLPFTDLSPSHSPSDVDLRGVQSRLDGMPLSTGVDMSRTALAPIKPNVKVLPFVDTSVLQPEIVQSTSPIAQTLDSSPSSFMRVPVPGTIPTAVQEPYIEPSAPSSNSIAPLSIGDTSLMFPMAESQPDPEVPAVESTTSVALDLANLSVTNPDGNTPPTAPFGMDPFLHYPDTPPQVPRPKPPTTTQQPQLEPAPVDTNKVNKVEKVKSTSEGDDNATKYKQRLREKFERVQQFQDVKENIAERINSLPAYLDDPVEPTSIKEERKPSALPSWAAYYIAPPKAEPVQKAERQYSFSDKEIRKMDTLFVKRLKAAETPEDERTIIVGNMQMILDCHSHPLGKIMYQFAETWIIPYQRINEPTPNTIQAISRTITDFKCVLINQCVGYFKSVADTEQRVNNYAEGVSKALWIVTYDQFFALCKKMHRAEDAVHASKIAEFKDLHPAHLGIKSRFWLTDKVDWTLKPVSAVDEPYKKAIQRLQCLTTIKNPMDKLQCVVETAQTMLKLVDRFWSKKPTGANVAVGGDELVPLLTYIILKANVPSIYSETCFMEDFIDEQAAMQEKGYILATLQTCLAYICCLEMEQTQICAKDIIDRECK